MAEAGNVKDGGLAKDMSEVLENVTAFQSISCVVPEQILAIPYPS